MMREAFHERKLMNLSKKSMKNSNQYRINYSNPTMTDSMQKQGIA